MALADWVGTWPLLSFSVLENIWRTFDMIRVHLYQTYFLYLIECQFRMTEENVMLFISQMFINIQ